MQHWEADIDSFYHTPQLWVVLQLMKHACTAEFCLSVKLQFVRVTVQHSQVKLSCLLNIPQTNWPPCFKTAKPLCMYVSRLLCQAVCRCLWHLQNGHQRLVSAHLLSAANIQCIAASAFMVDNE